MSDYLLPYPVTKGTTGEGTGTAASVLTSGLYVDLPGVWPLHCHIGWHLSEGKLAAMVYLPDKVKKLSKPAEWTGVSTALAHAIACKADASYAHLGAKTRSAPLDGLCRPWWVNAGRVRADASRGRARASRRRIDRRPTIMDTMGKWAFWVGQLTSHG